MIISQIFNLKWTARSVSALQFAEVQLISAIDSRIGR